MRAFIVLCLVAAACADHLGYNYHPVDHSYTPGGGHGGQNGNGGPGNGGFGSGSNPAPSYAGIGSGPSFGGNNAGPSYGGNNYAPGSGGSQGDLGAPSSSDVVAAPELDKEFYTFTADENDFNDPAASNQESSSLKQGLRVVFIKGPESNGLEEAALALAKQAASQQTAIYVLNKQTDLNDLSQKLNQITSNSNNKPDVHFVKYRTPEDAANAQRAIQSEYDNLGGPSRNFDGGIAPSLNFASKAPVAPSSGHHGNHGSGSAPQGSYGSPSSSQGSYGSPGSSQGSYGSPSSYAPQSAFLPQSAFAPQAPVPAQGSYGSQGSFGPQGSFGSQPSASGPSGSVSGGPSSTYLPASIFRRRFRF